MLFEIREVSLHEAEEVAHVQDQAFATTSPIHTIMYPNGSTQAAKANMLKPIQKIFETPNTTCYKVVDTGNDDRMVSFINWKTYKVDQPESEWNQPRSSKSDTPATEKHPDVNDDFSALFSANMDVIKRNGIQGRARIHIGSLVTHPDYFRRGSGKLLLDKCAEHANRLKLPTYLEASPIGAALYRRQGYIDVEGQVATMDLRPYGIDKLHENILMVRQPEPQR